MARKEHIPAHKPVAPGRIYPAAPPPGRIPAVPPARPPMRPGETRPVWRPGIERRGIFRISGQ